MRREALGKFLLQHIDRVIISLGLLTLIAFGLQTLRNVALTASDVVAPDELRRDFGELTVAYALNAGNNKPVFFNRYGDALLEYSAWSSFVTVDGITLDLWSHAFNLYVDKPTNRFILTFSTGRGAPQRGGPEPKRYQIEQQVDVTGSTVRIRYFIIPNQPVQTVRLILGHYAWYLERLRLSDGTASFDRPNLSRERYESGDVATRYTPVKVRLGQGAHAEVLRNATGAYALNVTYVIRSPAPYEKALIAEEEVILQAP